MVRVWETLVLVGTLIPVVIYLFVDYQVASSMDFVSLS